MRTDIPLIICGEKCHAKTDICVLGADGILFLVDKRHKEHKDAEPQLIAEVIAAFQTNNSRRTRVLGQDTFDTEIMPGITLVGSSPTFYFPVTPTVIYTHLPAVPRPALRLSEGMKPLDNRRHTYYCLLRGI
jgi:hypothetical protein